MGHMGRVGTWIHGCVDGVGQKFAWVTWVAGVYKILAWVNKFFAWVQNLAWLYVGLKFCMGLKFCVCLKFWHVFERTCINLKFFLLFFID